MMRTAVKVIYAAVAAAAAHAIMYLMTGAPVGQERRRGRDR